MLEVYRTESSLLSYKIITSLSAVRLAIAYDDVLLALMAESPYAFVTLLTSDSYLPGALALAAALRDVHTVPHDIPFQIVCLVTPQTVDVSTVKLLRRAFNLVIGVEAIGQENDDNLKLLGESVGDQMAILRRIEQINASSDPRKRVCHRPIKRSPCTLLTTSSKAAHLPRY